MDNIWRGNFTDMKFIGKFNKEIRFLLYATGICSIYAWIIPLQNKK